MAEDRYPNNENMHVSHETIYRSLFIQARGVLKKELMDHLRSKRRMRRSRHASEHGQSRGEDRRCRFDPRKTGGGGRPSGSRPMGRDLLVGAKNSYVATLVERHSPFVMLINVPGKET